ncbi:hypothetical protein EB796_017589 [Bugula neritina]|uniref:Uncharacterized protein n=1 Tax=Bugula neritina TaxID=10212 RepID=A0A7J7JCU6_BUGNE|nr:hypothetical protein EB796_017589 [Bugula neritina]
MSVSQYDRTQRKAEYMQTYLGQKPSAAVKPLDYGAQTRIGVNHGAISRRQTCNQSRGSRNWSRAWHISTSPCGGSQYCSE